MFGLLGRLKALLTPTNIFNLKKVLGALTDPMAHSYIPFWDDMARRGMTDADKVSSFNALRELLAIVKEYKA